MCSQCTRGIAVYSSLCLTVCAAAVVVRFAESAPVAIAGVSVIVGACVSAGAVAVALCTDVAFS